MLYMQHESVQAGSWPARCTPQLGKILTTGQTSFYLATGSDPDCSRMNREGSLFT